MASTVASGPASIVGSGPIKQKIGETKAVAPGSFDHSQSFYPRAQNAQIHPTVQGFFAMSNARIIKRYTHLNPSVSASALEEVLAYTPRFFRWAGADTFCVTKGNGQGRQTIIIETNSCPSGNKSLPLLSEGDEQNGYRRLISSTFLDMLKEGMPALLPPGTAGAGAASSPAASPSGIHLGLHVPTKQQGLDSAPPPARLRPRRDSAESVSSAGSAASGSSSASTVALPACAPLSLVSASGADDTCSGDSDDIRRVSSGGGSVLSCGSSGGISVVLGSSSGSSSSAHERTLSEGSILSTASSASASAPSPRLPLTPRPPSPGVGVLAVIYDKNVMEARAYAAAIADATGETVFAAEFFLTDPDPPVRWDADRRMHVRTPGGSWAPVRAAFRYVTQRPWTRIPLTSATPMINPILPCLAGGRNKMIAAKAYDLLNAELAGRGPGWGGLAVRTPHTVRDVRKEDVPGVVARFGGRAVVKVPYGNAGQGVFTILTPGELDAFMGERHHYGLFIVQALVGGPGWSSTTLDDGADGVPMYHVGTVPNARGETFVADLRVMVSSSSGAGFSPISMYARRAHQPLAEDVAGQEGEFSWGMLGTNLSVLTGDLTWSTESERLLLMDRRDFGTLGLGLDDLIDAYVQTVLAVTAIDRMCCRLVAPDGSFDLEAFAELNDDPALLAEILM